MPQGPGREQNPCHGGGGLRPVARSPGSQKGPSELRHLPVGLSSLVVWPRGRGGVSGQGSGRSLRVPWGRWSLASLRQPDPEAAAGGARETASEGESVWGAMRRGKPGSSGWSRAVAGELATHPHRPGPPGGFLLPLLDGQLPALARACSGRPLSRLCDLFGAQAFVLGD